MKKVEEYHDDNEANNRLIQKGLRELDLDSLYDLCAALGDKRDLLIRNLSKRVAAEVDSYLRDNENKIPEKSKTGAYFRFSRIMLALESGHVPERKDFTLDKLDFSTMDSVGKSLMTLHRFTVEGNLEKLAELIGAVDDRYMKKQLETILFGFDPLRAETRINRLQQRNREDAERKADLLKEGILSILSEESLETLYGKLDV